MGGEPQKVKIRRGVVGEPGLETLETILPKVVVPMAEIVVVVVCLVREQGETKSERQRDADGHEKGIFQ